MKSIASKPLAARLSCSTSRRLLGALLLTCQVALAAYVPAAMADPGDASDNADGAPTPPGKDFQYLFDRKSTWVEDKVDTLPPIPKASDLLPFEVSTTSPLTFAIDAKSISVGNDGVIRYAVVITSPRGARNINYEGIRCDTYEWKLYAAADEQGDAWDREVAGNWRRIEQSELNAYHAALYQDYMCESRLPQGKAAQIVKNIRYRHTASSRRY